MIVKELPSPEFTAKVPTERTIYSLLEKEKIDDKYLLLKTDWVSWFRNPYEAFGLLVSSLDKSGKINVIISQHEHTVSLPQFPNTIIFTPNATVKNNFVPIANYAPTRDDREIKDFNDRENLFFFQGCVNTNKIRIELCELFPENCFPTYTWGLDQAANQENKTTYLDGLHNTKFSLCPKGTEPSSIRVSEVLAAGSIPIIISDDVLMPLDDLDPYYLRVPENNVKNIPEIINLMSPEEQYSLWESSRKMYNEYFSNEKLHMPVLLKLNS